MSRTKLGLSRGTIAAAALAVADAEGFESVSMRRVALELDVGTMSLYYYVKNKDDLVAVMDDALMREALLPSLPKDWRRAIMEIAARTHDIFLSHPWALISMSSAAPGVNAMRHMEQCLEALAQTSMTAKQKLRLLAMVDDFVFGHALRQTASDKAMDMRFVEEQMATGNYPRLAEVFGGGGRVEFGDDRFKTGLALLLQVKEAKTRGGSKSGRRLSRRDK